MPGEDVEQYSLWIYDRTTEKTIEVDTSRWPDQTLAQVQWSLDSDRVYLKPPEPRLDESRPLCR